MRVLTFLADGFEEIEAITVIDILRRAGIEVVTVSTRHPEVQGSHGLRIIADARINEVNIERFDALFLPGGQPGTNNLMTDPRVLDIVRRFYQTGKLVTAICAAPTVLHAAGILAGKTVTSYPGSKAALTGVNYVEDRVVTDGTIVTSRGPGTAGEFALALVERIIGTERAQQLKSGMLYQ